MLWKWSNCDTSYRDQVCTYWTGKYFALLGDKIHETQNDTLHILIQTLNDSPTAAPKSLPEYFETA